MADIYVKCPTVKDFKLLMEAYEEMGWTWADGDLPLYDSKYCWGIFKENTIIKFQDFFCRSSLKGNNYGNELITVQEALERLSLNKKPKPQEWKKKVEIYTDTCLVTQNEIMIDGDSRTVDGAKAYRNKLEAALRQHKKHF